MTKPAVLLVSHLPEPLGRLLHERFDCHVLTQLDTTGLMALAPQLRGMVATGESVVSRALMSSLPALEVIAVLGVGYDGIDMAAARERGICVTHTPGLSTEDIADFALALLLAAARQVVSADKFVRRGAWPSGRYGMTRRVYGARLGIVGLGRIGRAVATRALAFGMDISYTGRAPKSDVAYRWCADARTLAAGVDFLVVCASGGAATRGLINRDVLAALGPAGVLINVGRGSIVDEEALLEALQERHILAAGLDVFCHEPHIAQGLLALENVVLTPHIASMTGATVQAMQDLTFANLTAHFDGLPVPTPVV